MTDSSQLWYDLSSLYDITIQQKQNNMKYQNFIKKQQAKVSHEKTDEYEQIIRFTSITAFYSQRIF